MHPVDEPFKLREIWPQGTVIKGDYSIEKRLGGGGFGTVYLARHRFLGTTHVIKRLHEQYASDAEYVRKFINEGRAIRRLKACPNIVEVEHMTQSEDGHLILVMEHISGGDLDGLMHSRILSVPEVIEYSRQIALALQAAHQAKLIHRDIKPQNVLVSQDSSGKPLLKLIDFGISADHLGTQHTSAMRGGSIGYAAPEQWVFSGKDLDGRCDLYALGATMYRMLVGRMPYPDVFDIGGWIERVKQGPPISPTLLRPDARLDLSQLILEMLSMRPEGRPADAGVVAARLAAMQISPAAETPRERTIRITNEVKQAIATPTLKESPRSEPPPPPASQPPEVAIPRFADVAPVPEQMPSGPLRALTIAGASAAVLGIVIWLIIPSQSPQQTTTTKETSPPIVSPSETKPKTKPFEPQPSTPKGKKETPPPKQQDNGNSPGVQRAETKPAAVQPPSQSPERTPAQQPQHQQPATIEPKPAPPAEPAVDHLGLGDRARDAGDYRTALQHYRAASDSTRIAALQRSVEGDTEDRAGAMADKGRYTDAITLIDAWLREFPGSQRLQRLKAKIVRARDSQ